MIKGDNVMVGPFADPSQWPSQPGQPPGAWYSVMWPTWQFPGPEPVGVEIARQNARINPDVTARIGVFARGQTDFLRTTFYEAAQRFAGDLTRAVLGPDLGALDRLFEQTAPGYEVQTQIVQAPTALDSDQLFRLQTCFGRNGAATGCLNFRVWLDARPR